MACVGSVGAFSPNRAVSIDPRLISRMDVAIGSVAATLTNWDTVRRTGYSIIHHVAVVTLAGVDTAFITRGRSFVLRTGGRTGRSARRVMGMRATLNLTVCGGSPWSEVGI